jgi:glycerophosphoryl diester phosphodiesterase
MKKMGMTSLFTKKGKFWLFFYVVYIVLFVIYLLFVLILEPYWAEINITVSGWVGIDFNIIFLIFLLIIVPLLYGVILLTVNLRRFLTSNEKRPHMFHKIFPFFVMILYTVLIIIFIDLLEDFKYVIFQFFEFYSYFIFLGLDLGLLVLLYPLIKFRSKLKYLFTDRIFAKHIKLVTFVIFIILCYVISLILPFFMNPANVITGALPEKPKLIAHRGASYLAPENTLKAGEEALKYDGVVGWEVDIQISFDGIPFLMHDHTLKRTTNVSAQFPSRKDDDPSLFTISELQQLDTGSWFVDKDPYGTIAKGIVTPVEAESYRGIKIPTFEEILNFTRDNNLFLDFDPYAPPASHPYHDSFYEIILNLTLDSGISLQKVMIPTTNTAFLELINSTTPNILLGWGGHPSLSEFQTSLYNYSYINTGDDYTNQEYRTLTSAGLRVMVWTIESLERYSQLWCLGVEWVKTNSPYKFNNLQQPILYFPSMLYYSSWIIIIITMIAMVLISFKFTTNKEQEHT